MIMRVLSNREVSIIDLAINMARQSNHPTGFFHGAVLVSRGKIINASCNKMRFSKFATRFVEHHGYGTIHAEMGAILNIEPRNLSGGTIYVVRLNSMGFLRLSKPCSMCQAAMSFVGIRRCIYSTGNDGFDEMRF